MLPVSPIASPRSDWLLQSPGALSCSAPVSKGKCEWGVAAWVSLDHVLFLRQLCRGRVIYIEKDGLECALGRLSSYKSLVPCLQVCTWWCDFPDPSLALASVTFHWWNFNVSFFTLAHENILVCLSLVFSFPSLNVWLWMAWV